MARWLASVFALASCTHAARPGAFAEGDEGGIGETGHADASSTGTAAIDPVVEVAISPSDVEIVVIDGVIPPAIAFVALGTTEHGETVPLAGTWSFERPDLAHLDGDALTATALAGGTATLTFTGEDGSATTDVTVSLVVVDDPVGVDPDVVQAFDGATLPDPALDLLYPYDQTVFPRGLAGPTLMWSGGGASDIYRVRIRGTTYDFTGYTLASPPSRYALPSTTVDVWRQLTDSTPGPVSVEIQRYDGVNAYLPQTQTWVLSTANLRGAIYYWEISALDLPSGDVVRLDPGASASQPYLERSAGTTCIGCHSVSRDGSTLVGSVNGGASPWGLWDASDGHLLFDPIASSPSGFQAISPDGTHVVWQQWTDEAFTASSMILSPADALTPLASLSPPAGAAVHPAWSPDGHTLAFGVRTDGNGLDFTQSTLWLADVDVDHEPPTLGGLRQLAAADPSRPTLTYPTFSPDSQWVAFMRATQSRARHGQAELWLAHVDGGDELLLDAASGGDLPPAHQHASFEPTFAPVAAGGYFWLVFVSERPYGNLVTDENPDTRRKQLWVAAIDAAPVAGGDPSHPAFWLPGQDPDRYNMRGSWAMSPCKALGAACEAGYECCEGFCIEDPQTGDHICGTEQACSEIDDACTDASDCCDETALCIGGFCSEPFVP